MSRAKHVAEVDCEAKIRVAARRVVIQEAAP
jgi:hypothetical protein